MKVGVLMPCRAPLDLVRASVGSVLAQTYADFRMVIVDDASPAPVREYLDRLADPACASSGTRPRGASPEA